MVLAEELQLDRLYANALRAVGQSRMRRDDHGGMEDLERSLMISKAIPAPDEAQRAYTGITNSLWELGQLEKAAQNIASTREWCERFPLPRAVQWLAGVEAIHAYKTGVWRDAERMANAFLSEVARSGRHYLEGATRYLRAYLRLAQGDLVAADLDTDAALVLSREAKDPQTLVPTLAARVRVLARLGASGSVAGQLMDESLVILDGCPTHWLVDVAWASVETGREEPFLVELDLVSRRSPWVDAGREIAGHRYEDATVILGAMGARGEEAYARLRAAEAAAAEGRRADADVQLQPALAFFRSVGAAGYVRQGEALLAAAS
jgi:hypothetical protein